VKIGGYQPCSLSDFDGHVSAVVFTQGCNYRCPFCHNRGLLAVSVSEDRLIPEREVLARIERRRGQLDAVVVSGGEPTLQPGLGVFLGAVRAMGFRTKLDTNGSSPGALGDLIGAGLLDYVAMDLKAPWPKYDLLTGSRDAAHDVADSVRVLKDSGVPHEFRTTTVPELLDRDDLAEITALLPFGSRHKLQPFRGGFAPTPCTANR
jgi:pyruvate formate lyase activating enzyme